MKRHIISAQVENRFGVLSRVAGLFSGRGYNIGSLTVNETDDPSVSRIVLTVEGDDAVIEQVTKQLNKLIDVIKVQNLTEVEHLERELMLLRVAVDAPRRGEIISLASIFHADIVDAGEKHLTLEVTGDNKKLHAFLDIVRPYGIQELVRTGVVGIARN
ncbi:MAG TPA: acetolactate synthase small subunit [bacterium]|nr:acetolactate synthase small subunit [bacterium]